MDRDLIIESLNDQNPWWIVGDAIKEDEKVREAFAKDRKLIYKFNEAGNHLIFGPKQVGKTTYFRLLIYDLIVNRGIDPRKIAYFSCEMLSGYTDILDVVKAIDIVSPECEYLFFDEISFVEDWQRAIKYLLDTGLLRGKSLYMTGSSSINLKKESFPGRNLTLREFLPLSFRNFAILFGSTELINILKTLSFEFVGISEMYTKAKKLIPFQDELNTLFYKFLECGGFPRAFYEYMENGKISEYTYDTYWRWIIYDIAKIGRSEKITHGTLRGVLKNYGTRFSLSSIAKETEIGSHTTVREYLEILEDLYIIRNVHSYDISRHTLIHRKMRKAYFVDPFIYHVVQRMVYGVNRADYPALVEGVVAEAVARRVGTNVGFHYGKKEIDVCFGEFGIEVKWQESVSVRDFPAVDVKNKVLLTKWGYPNIASDVLILPVSLFLAMI
ncbi:MAG: ATP-binding protein [Euryarchaeota archaeon]|nr:ATP-binding protein [Euryarchaeota archaeon]